MIRIKATTTWQSSIHYTTTIINSIQARIDYALYDIINGSNSITNTIKYHLHHHPDIYDLKFYSSNNIEAVCGGFLRCSVVAITTAFGKCVVVVVCVCVVEDPKINKNQYLLPYH